MRVLSIFHPNDIEDPDTADGLVRVIWNASTLVERAGVPFLGVSFYHIMSFSFIRFVPIMSLSIKAE